MSKKSKKKKEKKVVKQKKFTSGVDERLKQIQNIQPPDQNLWKMDNEKKIDGFLKFGFKKKMEYASIKEKNRNKFT